MPAAAPSLSASITGDKLTVTGEGFSPSSGGQRVTMWIDYAGDGGMYENPVVSDNGSFSVTYDVPPGPGRVDAIQWNEKRKRWLKVATDSF